ncbi:hypothetical protein [Mycolicibacterium psychrotolerans]|uniref:Uncharacterized protein n=1 Tax=Mycolicibacterium psychrotolerans TaxID=216929 RepID=A0A7I7M624_9MYCO|nr:hypothetical protein [Mycolicibacterium psychrotolerans]BBX67638.1 hypothetical protein MPSYJ_10990 [Mycolicibacterium psychrotolerans]
MIKKVFITAAAAVVMSVPLAGVAWADPAPDGGNNNPVGGPGGMPDKIGTAAGLSEPKTPGSAFSDAKAYYESQHGGAHTNTPTAYTEYINTFVAPTLGAQPWETTPGGIGIKTFTSGCNNGRHLTDGSPDRNAICTQRP